MNAISAYKEVVFDVGRIGGCHLNHIKGAVKKKRRLRETHRRGSYPRFDAPSKQPLSSIAVLSDTTKVVSFYFEEKHKDDKYKKLRL